MKDTVKRNASMHTSREIKETKSKVTPCHYLEIWNVVVRPNLTRLSWVQGPKLGWIKLDQSAAFDSFDWSNGL